ncbi:MAG TPA: ABC transporter permease [Acidobacteriaceae bacterium]
MRWLPRNRRYDDLDVSIREHIEERTEELIEQGMPRREAAQKARREFGNVTVIAERSRQIWQWPTVESIWTDLKFAARQLRNSPGFTVSSTLILSLGIGINTAVFSVVHHVLLEPLPLPKPHQLYAVWARSDAQGSAHIANSGPDFLDYQEQSRSFSSIAELIPHFTETWTGDGEPRLLDCTAISEDFFSMLGVRPYMGRLYNAHDYDHLDSDTILISYRFWKTKLSGDPHVLGRVIQIGGSPQTIIGITPPSLSDLFPATDVWPPQTTHPSWPFMKWRSNKFLTVIGRLKPGVTPAAAQEELTAIRRRAPGEPHDLRVQLTPLKDDVVGSARMQLRLIMLAVALVLFVACLNIAVLLLARAARRSDEMALRLSLGAERKRLLQQLTVEGFMLAAVACAPGVLLAWFALHLLPSLPGLNLPRLDGIHLNSTVLLATGAVAVATTLFFGWVPSWMFSSLDLASFLRSGRTATRKFHGRAFSGLIVAELACAMLFLVCAGLLLHSYWRISHVELGFEPDHMLTTYLRTNYYAPEGRVFWRDVLEDIASLPGVRAAAVADCTPGANAAIATLLFENRANDPNHAAPAQGCWASSDFFRVSGTPLLRGRFFRSSDKAESAPVVIINEEAARRYWPRQDPLGKRIAVNYTGPGRVGNSTPRMREIVGVVQGMKQGALEQPIAPAVYMPYLQDETNHDLASMSLFVRSDGATLHLQNSIRTRIHALRPDQPVNEIIAMQDLISHMLAPRRYSLSLLGAFAALALLLSAVGIYGTVSYTTLERRHEFGIRIALGATRRNVMAVVLRHGLMLATAGISAGVLAAIMITRVLAQLLFEISPLDAASFFLSFVLLGAISLVACIIPAMRVAYLDPVRALRSE